jgi:hypothetical protein
MRFVWALALVGSLLLPACNIDTPGTPTPTPQLDVSGRWASDLTFMGVTGRMTWQLTQSGMAVTGPVLVSLPSGTVILNGNLTGTLTGSSLPYTISIAQNGIPSVPSCAGQLAGTMTVATVATSMSGNLAVTSSTCSLQFSNNSLTLTKQ